MELHAQTIILVAIHAHVQVVIQELIANMVSLVLSNKSFHRVLYLWRTLFVNCDEN